jgi:hypothetical protein
MTLRLPPLLAGLIVAAAQFGCATGYQRADQTTDVAADTSARLDKAGAQVDAVLAALDGVVAAKGGDLRPPFTKFGDEADRTESAVESARTRAVDLRKRVGEHLDSWSQEAKAISNPELKQASAARREKARASADRVVEGMDKVTAASDIFLTDVKDLRTFLRSDLTAHGVDAAAPAIKKVGSDGQALKKTIDTVQDSIKQLRSELASPVQPPPPPPPAMQPATPASSPTKADQNK